MLGHGITAKVQGNSILFGTRKLLEDHNVEYKTYEAKMTELENQGKTVMLIEINGQTRGIVAVMDIIKQTAKQALAQLK